MHVTVCTWIVHGNRRLFHGGMDGLSQLPTIQTIQHRDISPLCLVKQSVLGIGRGIGISYMKIRFIKEISKKFEKVKLSEEINKVGYEVGVL